MDKRVTNLNLSLMRKMKIVKIGLYFFFRTPIFHYKVNRNMANINHFLDSVKESLGKIDDDKSIVIVTGNDSAGKVKKKSNGVKKKVPTPMLLT